MQNQIKAPSPNLQHVSALGCDACYYLAKAYFLLTDYSSALAYLNQVIQVIERMPPSDKYGCRISHTVFLASKCHKALGQSAKAQRYQDKSQEQLHLEMCCQRTHGKSRKTKLWYKEYECSRLPPDYDRDKCETELFRFEIQTSKTFGSFSSIHLDFTYKTIPLNPRRKEH